MPRGIVGVDRRGDQAAGVDSLAPPTTDTLRWPPRRRGTIPRPPPVRRRSRRRGNRRGHEAADHGSVQGEHERAGERHDAGATSTAIVTAAAACSDAGVRICRRSAMAASIRLLWSGPLLEAVLAIGGRQEASLSLVWTKVRAGMWSGQDAGMMYTIMQSRGPTFYVTRDIKRSPFAMTRSLALAKTMAQQDATEHANKREKSG
jgi:hypothetical protein